MREQLVSEEVALRITKAGFWGDSTSHFLYETDDGELQQDWGDTPNKEKLVAFVPSQQVAQRWIREELNKHIYIVWRPAVKKWVGILHTLDNPDEFSFTFLHDIYEQALDEALLDSLKTDEDDPFGEPYPTYRKNTKQTQNKNNE